MSVLKRIRSLCVYKLVVMATVLVALLPISILGYYVYHAAWEDSWREINEKHQLLAQNLAIPLGTYVDDHHTMLSMLTESVSFVEHHGQQNVSDLLMHSLKQSYGFNSLIMLDTRGKVIAYADKDESFTTKQLAVFAKEGCYLKVRENGKRLVSKMKRHPVNGMPTMFMGHAILDAKQRIVGVLLCELSVNFIENIRRKVRFGKKGHSAIVDQTGHVIAHPNPKWMTEIRDLSHISIVKKMMAGETGATKFYSPFIKANMVAGYAFVPQTGWGIMVPQPESEVAEHVNALMMSYLIWAVVGLILAVVLAIIVSRWVTKPINMLARASRSLISTSMQGNLPELGRHVPKEVRDLGDVLRSLIGDLQRSRYEVSQLNSTLQDRVKEATTKLRDANNRLQEVARQDHLTELANRRYFEDYFAQSVSRRTGDVDEICVMLIDIDHFKQINDIYGHAAGDAVLNQIARILEHGMRSGDMVARYGGDEFVAYMRCHGDVGLERARELRRAIDSCAIHWNGKTIHVTASIGLYCHDLSESLDINKILDNADNAMYRAKQQGRNRVVEISREPEKVN